MNFAWFQSIYQQSDWLEKVIDGLRCVKDKVVPMATTFVRDMVAKIVPVVTFFAEEAQGKFYSFVGENEKLMDWLQYNLALVFTVIGLMLMLASHFSSWKTTRATAAQKEKPKLLGSRTASMDDAISQAYNAVSPRHTTPSWPSPPSSTTTLTPPSTPAHTTPTAATSASTFKYYTPYTINRNLSCLPSTPGPQTPSNRTFSHLAHTAPASYHTLQRNGVLNADGTPSKKFALGKHKEHEKTETQAVYESPTESWGNLRRIRQRQREFQFGAVEDEEAR
ncbi:hypothetical protein C7974DRAFT_372623 [Boeremia exigua]|uniref:uncharacterized protein n=1 Tax=Boeremia exigua TaxID=749465 RepID=UPI001E8D4809|nr:uncharacterized protein C7974DRAFT_372623 [Boeremia exigua]KAH6642741.1 hypothetical protein C7974DRAFT_372623 [Boeremia exigua]